MPARPSSSRHAAAGLATLVALIAATLTGLPATGAAQQRWQAEAVPYYGAHALVQGQAVHWYAPQAQAFAAAAARLDAAVRQDCGKARSTGPQAAWREAHQAWVRLSAVSVGPLVLRRSARRIDFQPTRAEAVQRAIEQAPAGAVAMDRVPSPAKGFGALAWLLWRAPQRDAATCTYAAEVAADLLREAEGLQRDWATRAAEPAEPTPDEAVLVERLDEALNQWVGGLEQLRLQGLLRPTEPELATPGASAIDERAPRWLALKTLTAYSGRRVPDAAPGAGLVPIETFLRGRGLNPLADRLAAAVRKADTGLVALGRGGAGSGPARNAAKALAQLGALVETEVAPALDVRMGFTDADGD